MRYSDEVKAKLQNTELEMLKFLKRICDKYDIRYFLIGGTLLGAVRHGGFIPWDDDIDVGMERNQYEKFIKIWTKYYMTEQKQYILQCKEFDKMVPLPFAKLRKNGTYFLEKETYESDLHHGIFIDIFPFDAIPEKVSIVFKLRYNIFRTFMVVTEYKNGYREFSRKFGKIFCRCLSWLPYEFINKYQYKFMTQYNSEKCKYLTSYASGYGYERHKSEKENFCGEAYIQFEDEMFRCPVDCPSYLIGLYGENYMELPPVEQRGKQHNVLEVRFEDEESV